MAVPAYINRCAAYTQTSGTSDMVLDATAISGWRARSALTNGATYNYSIRDNSGAAYEDGQGVWNSGTNTLTRATVFDSSNSDAKISLSGSSAFVIVGLALAIDTSAVALTLIAQTTQALMRTTGLGMSSDGSSLVSAANYAAMVTALGFTTGTYTPQFYFGGTSSGWTYTQRGGAYIKFPNGMVLFTATIQWNTAKGSGTGLFQMTLPFAVTNISGISGDLGQALTMDFAGLTFAADQSCYAKCYAGTSNCYFYGANIATSGGSSLSDTAVSASGLLTVTGMYQS